MINLLVSFTLGLILGVLAGVFYRRLIDTIKRLEELITPPKAEERPDSVLMDVETAAKVEHEAMLKKLNQ